jgi:hypothetical protein
MQAYFYTHLTKEHPEGQGYQGTCLIHAGGEESGD